MAEEIKERVVCNERPKITFAFIGDVCLGSEFIERAIEKKLDYLYPFEGMDNVFAGADIGVANLEGPICSEGEKRRGVSVHLINNLAVMDMCLKYNLKVLCLGNNHIMDYGAEGLQGTHEVLANNGLFGFGAGMNSREANRPLIVNCKGRRVGFLAFTTQETHVRSVLADDYQAGCESVSNVQKACRRIESLKNSVDIVCVALHWGHEYYEYPSLSQVEIAHRLVDAGANYVIGHHPHVIQGIERYKDSLIVYSLGNFFFPAVRADSGRLHYQKKLCREFMVIVSESGEDGKISFHVAGGIVMPDFMMKIHKTTELARFRNKVRKLSEPLSRGDYEKMWSNYKRKRERELMREALFEAAVKASRLSFREVISTISYTDVKRNIARCLQILSR